MKSLLQFKLQKKHLVLAGGIVAGIGGGFVYYHFYGCTNGCPINSNPYLTMIWGGLMGYLVTDLIWDKIKKKPTE